MSASFYNIETQYINGEPYMPGSGGAVGPHDTIQTTDGMGNFKNSQATLATDGTLTVAGQFVVDAGSGVELINTSNSAAIFVGSGGPNIALSAGAGGDVDVNGSNMTVVTEATIFNQAVPNSIIIGDSNNQNYNLTTAGPTAVGQALVATSTGPNATTAWMMAGGGIEKKILMAATMWTNSVMTPVGATFALSPQTFLQQSLSGGSIVYSGLIPINTVLGCPVMFHEATGGVTVTLDIVVCNTPPAITVGGSIQFGVWQLIEVDLSSYGVLPAMDFGTGSVPVVGSQVTFTDTQLNANQGPLTGTTTFTLPAGPGVYFMSFGVLTQPLVTNNSICASVVLHT